MFKKKDVIRTLFLFMVILVIMVTLSQILVVHKRNHHTKKSRDAEKARGMLTMLLNIEKSIEAMMKKEYLPAARYWEELLAEVYAERIRQQLVRLNNLDQIDVVANSKHRRKFGDDTYTVFHERKLRFLEIYENELMTKMKSEFVLDSRDRDDTLDTRSDESNANNHILSKHNAIGSVMSKDNPEHQSTDTSKKLIVSKPVNNSTNMSGHFYRHINYSINGHQLQNAANAGPTLHEKCPDIPKDLEGKSFISPRAPDHHTDEMQFSDIQPGGYWKPGKCIARQRVAIIIPYRNREIHLHTLLHYIIPVLRRQLIEFRIFVPEQYGTMTFNKGRVMNAGFMEAWKLWTFDCVVFHDVDLLPENDKNMYTCGRFPRHMSISVDKFSYRLPYWTLVGGVFSVKREQFLKVNGYSNLYWGWGAEDDDMAYRLKTSNLKIERPPANIGRYKMIKHANRETSPVKMRAYLLKTVRKRYHRDGLNTLDYRVVFINNTKLYTHIMVDIGQPPEEAANITKLLN